MWVLFMVKEEESVLEKTLTKDSLGVCCRRQASQNVINNRV